MSRPSDPNARLDLLRAAEAIFVEHGLALARVEDITARAGRSKGAFYLHFKSKEDAFRQVVESMVARMGSFLEEMDSPARPNRADATALLAFWREKDREIFEYLWQNRGLARLAFDGGRAAGYAYLIDEFAERARRHLERALADGVAQGIYRADLDVGLAALLIAGAYDRLARELVAQMEKPDLESWVQRLQSFFVRGIGSASVLSLLDSPVNVVAPRAARRSKP